MTTATRRKPEPTRQPELRGMPAKTKSVLRAEDYCHALDIVESKKETAEHARLALIGQLKADNAIQVVCLDSIGQKRKFTLESIEKLKATKAGR